MRMILRALFEIGMAIVLVLFFAPFFDGMFQDALSGMDGHTRSGLMLILGAIPAVLIADWLGRAVFPPRIRVHGAVRQPANPGIAIVVVERSARGGREPRVVTVRRDGQGRYLVPVDDDN